MGAVFARLARVCSLMSVVWAFSAFDGLGQGLEDLRSGDRVRVHAASMEGEFLFEGLDGDELLLGATNGPIPGSPLRMPLADVEALQLRVSHAGRGFRRGALIGFGVTGLGGAILGAAAGALSGDSGSGAFFGGFVLGIPGALVGGGIGAAVAGSEWKPVDLSRGIERARAWPGGGIQVMWSYPIH